MNDDFDDPRRVSARLAQRRDVTGDLALFDFEPERPLVFEAGQWTQLTLRDPAAADELVTRPYTIASAPHEPRITLYVRRVHKPRPGRLTSMLWQLAPGAEVRLSAPRGRFTLEAWRSEPAPRTLLMLAGGTGLAPFAAQLEALWREGAPAPIVLCHGVSYAAELGLRERFEELARAQVDAAGRRWRLRYLPTVSRPTHERNAGWRGACGRVEALLAGCGRRESPLELALGHTLDPEHVFAMACGYARTLENVQGELRARGFVGPRRAADGALDLLLDSFGEDGGN